MARKRIGFSAGTQNNVYTFGQNQPNVVSALFAMPEDGWIVSMGAVAGGAGGAVTAKFAIWGPSGPTPNSLLWKGSAQQWIDNLLERGDSIPGGLPMARGSQFFAGFWRDPNTPARYATRTNPTAAGGHQRRIYAFPDAPDRQENYDSIGDWLVAWVDYVPNLQPPTPDWRPPLPFGRSTSQQPYFSGYLPIRPEEEGLDQIERVHLRVRRLGTDRLLYDDTFELTDQEKTQGWWVRQPVTLVPGRDYGCRFRVMDYWGVWSNSKNLEDIINVDNGPYPPVPVGAYGITPTGQWPNGGTGGAVALNNANVTGSLYYSGWYKDPSGSAIGAMRVQVFNGSGNILVADSGWQAPSFVDPAVLNPYYGKPIRLNQFHGDLGFGRALTWRMKTRNAAGLESSWSYLVSFSIDAIPQKPSQLSPANGISTPSSILQAVVADPNGDRIKRLRWKVYDVNGALLAGYPIEQAVDVESGSTVKFSATGLTLGSTYSWTLAAQDGINWGPDSDKATFSYVQVPTVVMISPNPAGLVNLVRAPSAEYPGDDWNIVGAGASFTRPQDSDASSGDACWEITATATTASTYFRPDNSISVDVASDHYVLFVELKAINGTTPQAQLQLECRDAGNNVIGTPQVAVDSPIGLQTPTTPNPYWSRWGGLVDPLPAGTVNVKPVLVMPAASTGVLRVDDWYLAKLPNGAPADSLYVANLDSWYGYFDGDLGNDIMIADEGYSWTGNAGFSSSRGYNVLWETSPQIEITYQSSSSPKSADRLEIQQYDGVSYRPLFDTGWVSGSRTLIPMPSGVLRNGVRYQARVSCKDSQPSAQVGQTNWVTFDVNYEGPKELAILAVGGDYDTGSVGIDFQATDLPQLNFGGVEIAVGPLGEPRKSVVILNDVTETHFQYHFPISGRQHTIWLRQIEVMGGDYVPGRWTRTETDVNYEPWWWLKDAENPEKFSVRFDPPQSSPPGSKSNTPISSFADLWGIEKPVDWVGEQRYRTGKVTISLFDDPWMQESADERLTAIEGFEESGKTLCLLSLYPGRKRFVTVTGFSYGLTATRMQTVEISYSETYYEEDVFLRESNAYAT